MVNSIFFQIRQDLGAAISIINIRAEIQFHPARIPICDTLIACQVLRTVYAGKSEGAFVIETKLCVPRNPLE
jgi:hypothetical protein